MSSRRPVAMLYFGIGDPSFDAAGAAVDSVTVVEPSTCVWTQLPQQFDVVAIDAHHVGLATPETRRAVVHAAVQHLSPGGRLIATFPRGTNDAGFYEQMCAEFDLELDSREIDDSIRIAHRRAQHATIHDLLCEARSRIKRIEPVALHEALDSPNPPTVIDTRTSTDRERFGVIPSSIHILRTTLEWACDSSTGYRHPEIVSREQSLVVVCNGGYSSSLAASNLALLGFTDVGDLIGGHQAWVRAGLDVVRPDHSSLGY